MANIDLRVKAILDAEAMGFHTVVELGAGKFNHIAYTDAKVKIGIEIFEDYLDDFVYDDVYQIAGNMLDFDKILEAGGMYRFDCAMLLDSLEHVQKTQGIDLLSRLKKRCHKIIVFAPCGTCVQLEDKWGYNNPYQRHVSSWREIDLERLSFDVSVFKRFHERGEDAMLGVWVAR